MVSKVRDRLLLTKGILKALFTTLPTHATEVVVKENGKLMVKDAASRTP